MDLADLVHAARVAAGRVVGRRPAVHFALAGALLYAGASAVDRWRDGDAAAERPRLEIPASRVALARQELMAVNERPPTPDEERATVRHLADEEILFRYALELGLDRGAVARRRLAQIATFVAEDPHEARSESERVDEAMALGLHQGDLVVRRILIDASARLIRAAVLAREPSEEVLEDYLRGHPEDFLSPAKVRFSHVALASVVREERLDDDARALLDRLRTEGLDPEAATELGDGSPVTPHLPLLAEREIARRFGHAFVQRLADVPVGTWQGPLPSRYGLHLVFVHERQEPRVRALDEVRKDVSARARRELADAWLETRLEQLRAGYDIVIGEGDRA